MIKTLDAFSVGESGIVKSINGEGRVKRRFLDMGVVAGTEIFLRKKAPLGDPIEVTVRNYELSLRKSEARQIIMEVR